MRLVGNVVSSCRAQRVQRATHRQCHQQQPKQQNDPDQPPVRLHGDRLDELERRLKKHPDLAYGGFVHDAQKEFAEGCITLALVTGQTLPEPDGLKVRHAAYLNGMAEAVGELRRYLLDSIRRNQISRAEELMTAMDDIYGVLVTMDFPDALTGGLRRATDMVRGILERTRSDLTLTMRQGELEKRLRKYDTGKEDKE